MNINASTLRMLWTVVETLPRHTILSLSDTALIAMLMKEVSRQIILSGEEVGILYGYIGSRLHLIRDIATFPANSSMELVAS